MPIGPFTINAALQGALGFQAAQRTKAALARELGQEKWKRGITERETTVAESQERRRSAELAWDRERFGLEQKAKTGDRASNIVLRMLQTFGDRDAIDSIVAANQWLGFARLSNEALGQLGYAARLNETTPSARPPRPDEDLRRAEAVIGMGNLFGDLTPSSVQELWDLVPGSVTQGRPAPRIQRVPRPTALVGEQGRLLTTQSTNQRAILNAHYQRLQQAIDAGWASPEATPEEKQALAEINKAIEALERILSYTYTLGMGPEGAGPFTLTGRETPGVTRFLSSPERALAPQAPRGVPQAPRGVPQAPRGVPQATRPGPPASVTKGRPSQAKVPGLSAAPPKPGTPTDIVVAEPRGLRPGTAAQRQGLGFQGRGVAEQEVAGAFARREAKRKAQEAEAKETQQQKEKRRTAFYTAQSALKKEIEKYEDYILGEVVKEKSERREPVISMSRARLQKATDALKRLNATMGIKPAPAPRLQKPENIKKVIAEFDRGRNAQDVILKFPQFNRDTIREMYEEYRGPRKKVSYDAVRAKLKQRGFTPAEAEDWIRTHQIRTHQ